MTWVPPFYRVIYPNFMNTNDLNQSFNEYFTTRAAKTTTPEQKKALIHQLRLELKQEGRLPLPTGPFKLDTKHKMVRAALEGHTKTTILGSN